MSDHTHEHTHTYTHEHDGHHHHDQPIPETKDRMVALLDYNCQHNESHADELKKLSAKLKEQGKDAAAAKVDEACDSFTKGNASLREALELLKEV